MPSINFWNFTNAVTVAGLTDITMVSTLFVPAPSFTRASHWQPCLVVGVINFRKFPHFRSFRIFCQTFKFKITETTRINFLYNFQLPKCCWASEQAKKFNWISQRIFSCEFNQKSCISPIFFNHFFHKPFLIQASEWLKWLFCCSTWTWHPVPSKITTFLCIMVCSFVVPICSSHVTEQSRLFAKLKTFAKNRKFSTFRFLRKIDSRLKNACISLGFDWP